MLQDLNSQFSIVYQQDGVYLIINPSNISDKSALLTHIIDKVASKSIKNVDKKAIQVAVESSKGDKVKIAEAQDEVKLDSTVNVFISPDKMIASVNITVPEGGRILKADEILAQIRAKGIIYGIDELAVIDITVNSRYGESIKIAEGNTAIKGEDGKLEILFDTSGLKKPTILEDGSVDYHELNFIKTVQKGQALANIIAPKPGVDGKNVLGQVLSAPKGKPIPNPKGKNVEFINNGNTVAAIIDGYASFVDNKVSVATVLEIPGNVDVSTGNIHFNGNVIVRGNVVTDFVIEATGDVEVHGVVEGAIIKAEGDIILKRGIQGLHKGILVSGHDIVARYIEHSTITARNDIKCEAIMHSNVSCGNTIELAGKKGLIVGGIVKVGKEVHAKVIGSPMCTVTDLEVGTDPTVRDKYKEIKDKHTNYEGELSRAEKSIEVLKKMQSAGSLTPDKREMLGKLLQVRVVLTQQVKELEEELEVLESELTSMQRGRIKVRNIIYPGVKITMGSVSKFIKENMEFVSFHLEGADIKSGIYE